MSRKRKQATAPGHARDGRAGVALHRGEARSRLALFLGIYVLLSLLLFDPKLSTGGDNAVYLILAKSIAQGKGYLNLYLPGAPAHTQYPFGFPLLLASVVWIVGGVNVIAAKLLVLLTGIGATCFAYGICRQLFPERANLVAAFMLSIPMFIVNNHWVFSEVPFLCFSLGAIYFLLKAKPGRELFYWLGMGFAAYASLLRSAGIALVLGVLVFLLLKKRYKLLGIFLALFLLAFVPWQVRNARAGGQPYLAQLLARHPYIPDYGRANARDFALRVWRNLRDYVTIVLPIGLLPVIKPGWLARVVGVLFASLAVLGFVRRLKRWSVIETYMPFVVLVLLGWPELWMGERFLLPFVPLIVFYVFTTLDRLGEKLEWRRLTVAVVALLAALNCFMLVRLAKTAVTDNINYLHGDRYAGYSSDWRRYFEAIEWIGESIPADKVVLARKPEFVYLLSGRQSICYPFTYDHAKVRQAIEQVDYILYDDFRWNETTKYFLAPVLQEELDRYPVLHQTSEPPFYVLAVRRK